MSSSDLISMLDQFCISTCLRFKLPAIEFSDLLFGFAHPIFRILGEAFHKNENQVN